MARQGDPTRVIRAAAAWLLLSACIAPGGAAMATIRANAAQSAVTTSTSSWRAINTMQNDTGTVGSPLAISSAAWVKVSNLQVDSKANYVYPIDLLNKGTERLSTELESMTVGTFFNGSGATVALWLCPPGLTWWTNNWKCGGLDKQAVTFDSMLVNSAGTYTFSCANSSAPADCVVAPGARLSLLITLSNVNKAPTETVTVSALVSRSLSVRTGTVTNS